MSRDDSPGPNERYCTSCRAVISEKAAMCPECGTMVGDRTGSRSGGGGRPSRRPESGSPDDAGASSGTTSSTPEVPEFPVSNVDVDRGDAYAVAGALSLVLSGLSFVGSFVFAFSLFLGLVMLPVTALLAVVGTGLGGYAYLSYRSRFGAGVALVGSVEVALGLGFVALLVLAIFGVIAWNVPFKWIYRLLRLLELAAPALV